MKPLKWGLGAGLLIVGLITGLFVYNQSFFAISTPVVANSPVPEAVVTLIYEENAQVELIGSKGQRVLVDVNNPDLLSSPVVQKDILLTTRRHEDHFNSDFQAGFKGDQLFVRSGQIIRNDVKITGIPSCHNQEFDCQFLEENGSNYIYLIEMDHLKIAHFGDIGQNKLTQEQLKLLKGIDVAITQFENADSHLDLDNKIGFVLMDQIQPRMVIPFHFSMFVWQYAIGVQKWQGYYTPANSLTINSSDLKGRPTVVLFRSSERDMKIPK